MERISKHHATPQAEFDRFGTIEIGTTVWQLDTQSWVVTVSMRNELARDPSAAPRVLGFMAIGRRQRLGTFCSFSAAVSAVLLDNGGVR